MSGPPPCDRTEPVQTIPLLLCHGRRSLPLCHAEVLPPQDLGQIRYLVKRFKAPVLIRTLAEQYSGSSLADKLELIWTFCDTLQHEAEEE
uniref:Movement protein n=1 Tax=Eragrostis curvula streak virus TaxID=638358 RepID=C3UV61_9GEMI|nr:movement protein [Eragrostis curvula streak virus]